MKTQLRKPARDRASYTDQCKQERWSYGGQVAAVLLETLDWEAIAEDQ